MTTPTEQKTVAAATKPLRTPAELRTIPAATMPPAISPEHAAKLQQRIANNKAADLETVAPETEAEVEKVTSKTAASTVPTGLGDDYAEAKAIPFITRGVHEVIAAATLMGTGKELGHWENTPAEYQRQACLCVFELRNEAVVSDPPKAWANYAETARVVATL